MLNDNINFLSPLQQTLAGLQNSKFGFWLTETQEVTRRRNPVTWGSFFFLNKDTRELGSLVSCLRCDGQVTTEINLVRIVIRNQTNNVSNKAILEQVQINCRVSNMRMNLNKVVRHIHLYRI